MNYERLEDDPMKNDYEVLHILRKPLQGLSEGTVPSPTGSARRRSHAMRWKLSMTMLCVLLGLSLPAWAQSGDSPGATQLNKVDALEVVEGEDGTYIRLSGSEVATFSVFKLNDPLRLFVDISNSEIAKHTLTEDVQNGVISRVALIEFEDSYQRVARLIIGFDRAAHYDVRTEGNDVVVFVDGAQRRGQTSQGVASAELQQKQARLSVAERRLSDSEQRYGQAVSELDATRDELQRAKAELEAMQARVASTSGQERRDLEASIASQNGALKTAQAQVEERERQVKTMAGQIAELEAQRVQSQRQHQAALERANERTAELEKSLTRTQQELAAIAAEKESAQGRIASMSAEVNQTTARVQAQRKQLEEAQKREAELEVQLNELRASAASGNTSDQQALASVERERARWQTRLTQYTKELEQSQAQQAQSQQRLSEFEKMVSARDAEIARLKSSQSAEQGRLSQVLEQRAALEQELATARRELASTQAENARQAELREARPAAQAVPVDANGANTVRGIRLETTPEGRSRIVVELDRPGQFETLPWKDSRAVMILNNVELPRHLERTLSADAQGGAVRFVSSFSQRDGQVRMEAELRSDASEMIHQEGNQLVWEFASAVAKGGQGGLGEDAQPRRSADGESFTAAPPNYPRVVVDPTRVSSVPGMSRKRLTIDLRNADIQNVLRLIAQEGGVNIIASSGVTGAVTMRLRSVPLDEVFLTILQSLQLGFELRGNVIRVAPQSVLVAEESARIEARVRAQRVQPLEVFLLPINYASAGDLSAQVGGLLSPRGSVTVDDRTNTLIIKDLPENLGAIRMLIESLDAQVPQVLIEARIVETNDTFSRQIGVQWGGDISFSQGNGNPTGLIFPSVLGVAGGATDGQTPTQGTSANPNFAVNLPAPAGTGAGGAIGLTMGSVGGGVNLNLRLSAMEEAGHAKIVSSPRILTLDNRQATISQGTSIPISVVSAAGVQTVFVDATLELTVTPHVTPDGNIRLAIQATKNEPDFQNTGARGDPTIIRRQAETELLIKDGDTTVIGGIYTRNAGHSLSVVPFFHKIPVLGFFFRTTSESERRSELLIFITPRIVNRAEALGVMSAGTLTGAEEFAPAAAQ